MGAPIVSIVIPTHNRAWSIKRAIDSVLAQQFTDAELIVVDDGSTDETKMVLGTYGDKIMCFSLPHCCGASAARNKGIQESSGRFIALLDSDDEWMPDKLLAQRQFFDSHPEYLICQTTERWVRHGTRVNKPDSHKKLPGMIFEESLHKCMVTCSSVMMKRELLDEVGLFNESLFACEDYDLWLRITCKYPVGLIEKDHLIRYGGHEDQLSSASHGNDKYRIRAMLDLMNHEDLSNRQKEATENELRRKCEIYSKGCIKRGKRDEAERFKRITKQKEF